MKSAPGFTTQLVSDDPYHVVLIWVLQHGSKRVVNLLFQMHSLYLEVMRIHWERVVRSV